VRMTVRYAKQVRKARSEPAPRNPTLTPNGFVRWWLILCICAENLTSMCLAVFDMHLSRRKNVLHG